MAVVNAVMAQAQAAGQYEGFRPHTTRVHARPAAVASLPPIARDAVRAEPVEADQESLSWRDSLTVPRELPEEKLVALECRQAARVDRAAASQRASRRGDIMVLARRRDRLAAMEEELRALHIPAQQPEKTDLCEAPEVQDIVALLDVLVSPDARPVAGAGAEVAAVRPAATTRWSRWLSRRGRRRPTAGPRRGSSCCKRRHDLAPGLLAAAAQAARLESAGWSAGRRTTRWMRSTTQGDVLARFARLHSGALARNGAGQPARPAGRGAPGRWRALCHALWLCAGAQGGRHPGARAVGDAGACACSPCMAPRAWRRPSCCMLDTDGAPARAETMGVLVEWPGEAPAPWRFAFIASETRPPACSAEALERGKDRAPARGAQCALRGDDACRAIGSCCRRWQPHAVGENSWWQRLQALCTPIEAPRAAPALADSRRRRGAALPAAAAADPVGGEARRRPARRRPGTAGFRTNRVSARRCTACWRAGPAACDPSPRTQVRRVAREFALDRCAGRRGRGHGAAHPFRRGRLGLGPGRAAIGRATKYRCITKANCCGWTAWCAAPARASGGCSTTRRQRGPNSRTN